MGWKSERGDFTFWFEKHYKKKHGKDPSYGAHGQPSESDLLDFFESLEDDHWESKKMYQKYAQGFYVAITVHANDASADVTWPGGYCDSWAELEAVNYADDRRIIDCEGYAFLAKHLLGAANWTFKRYVAFFKPKDVDLQEGHVAADLYHEKGKEKGVVGTQEVSNSEFNEGVRVFGHGVDNTTGNHATPPPAYEEAKKTARENRDKEERQSWAGQIPPRFNAGRPV